MAEGSDETGGRAGSARSPRNCPPSGLKKEAQNLITALGENALTSVTNLGDGGGSGLSGSR